MSLENDTDEDKFFKRLKGVARQVAWNTRDALSFYAFGITEWIKCAEYLENTLKLNERDIERVLRSKHMRWARDSGDEPYGECTVWTLIDYHERYPTTITESVREWDVDGY